MTLGTALTLALLAQSRNGSRNVVADDGKPEPPVPRRVIVVAASVPCGLRLPDRGFAQRIGKETAELVATLARVAASLLPPEPVIWNPSSRALLARIKMVNEPLWFIYVGHGRIDKNRQSAVCLPDGDQPIGDLVKELPAGRSASFWFNTCSSAVVDVRRFDTSVFSASTRPTATKELGTPVGEALTRAIEDRPGESQPTDVNCDGMITDQELFTAVRPHLPAYGRAPPRPKLRRQGWAEIPLFTVRRLRGDCPSRTNYDEVAQIHPGLAPVLEREHRYRDGMASSEEETPPVVWVWKGGADQVLAGTVRPQFLVSATPAVDERLLARAMLLPRIWTISEESGFLTVRDARAPDRAPLWSGPAGEIQSLFDAQGERRALFNAFGPRAGLESKVLRRFTRPVTEQECTELQAEGFVPAACEEPLGQCYRRPPTR